jgi:hypothetical protein
LHLCSQIAFLGILEETYSYRNPIYIVAGDFNFNVEEYAKTEELNGWEVHPTSHARETLRQLRKEPIDFILMLDSAPDHQFEKLDVKNFSPLPVKLLETVKSENSEDPEVFIYGFSNASGYLSGKVMFSSSHPELKNVENRAKGWKRQILSGILHE